MKSPLALKLDRLLAQARQAGAAGKRKDQFDALYAAIALAPDAPAARGAMGRFMVSYCPLYRHPDIDRMLSLALEQAWARPTELAPSAIRYIAGDQVMAHALAMAAASPEALHAAAYYLERHPVFHALARVAPLADPAWQTLLARLREFLLAQRYKANLEAPLHLALALALQNDLTEGIEPPGPATLGHAQELEARCLEKIEAGIAVAPADIALAVAALPLDQTALAPCLASPFAHKHWPELLPLLRLPAERQHEAVLRTRLQSGAAQAADTDPVRAQYEAHPYPRWVREPLGEPAYLAPAVVKRLKRGATRGMQVLVAGCGTGQQLFVARDKYPRAHLVAVDFSVTSLAHAMRKCEEAGLDNIEFHAMDLHRIAELPQRYDAIECAGVLHHLPDPEAGLAVLTSVLQAQGLLYLAVYSPYARTAIAALRERIAALGADSSSSGIRAFRRKLLDEQPDTLPAALVQSPDFHVTSGLRDLLFHARECALPLPEWVGMAQRQGLDMIALEVAPAAAEQARRLFKREPERLSATQWDEFEQANPSVFSGMYRMWLARQ